LARAHVAWAGDFDSLEIESFLAFVIYFDIIRIMETLNAAELLAALGHESRLAIFRLLVEAGPKGVNASAISEQLGLAPATLSFHLSHLSRVGLIEGERESRFIHYSANFATMDELIAFLTRNCCEGNACLPKTSACNPIP
jgi:DNA-binding transcriptional ArsR family regulator